MGGKQQAKPARLRLDRHGRKPIAEPSRALEREWYAKLKATGFDDIEVYDNNSNTYLRGHHLEARKRVVRGTETGTAERMRLAEEWLELEAWPTRTERWLWSAWSKGGWDYLELAARWPRAVSTAQTIRAHFTTRLARMWAFFKERLAKEERERLADDDG